MSIEHNEVHINGRSTPRFKRDRSRTSSKLKWNNVSSTTADRKSTGLKVEDYEPAFALRKIALLYEKNLNEEVADLIGKLSISTLQQIYTQFPLDLFIDGIPQTLAIVNTLYSRLLSNTHLNEMKQIIPFKSLQLQIIKLHARNLSKGLPKLRDWEKILQDCENLLKIIAKVDGVKSLKMLRKRRYRIRHSIDNFGEHGMTEVETSLIDNDEVHSELLPLPIALRVELDRMISNCKITRSKLIKTAPPSDRFGSKNSSTPFSKLSILDSYERNTTDVRSHPNSDLPYECNHQQILNFTSQSIQDRLFKNKALLNVIEPSLLYAQLPRLVDILNQRIEKDKDILSTFCNLRKDIVSVSSEARILPTLRNYEEAFTIVIDEVKKYVEGDTGTPETLSINESNFDDTLSKSSSRLMSSIYTETTSNDVGSMQRMEINKSLLSTSDTSSIPASSGSVRESKASSDEKNKDEDERIVLKEEVERLRKKLSESQRTIDKLKEREEIMIMRIPELAKDPDLICNRQATDKLTLTLASKFRSLYSKQTLQNLTSLERTWSDGEDETIIKSKILFSIIVISFRSSVDQLNRIRYQLHSLICAAKSTLDGNVRLVESTFNQFLQRSSDTYDLTSNIEKVFSQICEALYDHPRLKHCEKLKLYVVQCVKLSWSLAVHHPPLSLDYDSPVFDPCIHTRFPTSDPTSQNVLFFLWPALIERETGKCVSHGMVVTG